MKNLIYCIISILSLTTFSCKPKPHCTDGVTAKLVDKSGLDGCTWLIELEDGSMLQPLNLDSFNIEKQNDLSISLTYKKADAFAGICMAGQMVELSCIHVINN